MADEQAIEPWMKLQLCIALCTASTC